MQSDALDAVIVGGGITGLVIGYRLQQAGRTFRIIDPGRPGGLILSRQVEHFTLECGPGVFVEKPALKKIVAELPSLLPRYPAVNPYQQLIWFQGKPIPAPRSPRALLTTPLFTLREKLAIASRMFRKGVLRPTESDSSVAEFFTPLLGSRAVFDVLDPALKGIYGGDVSLLSARSLFPGLWEAAVDGKSMAEYFSARGARGSIFVLGGGAQTLVAALLESISPDAILPAAVIDTLPEQDGTWRVRCSDGAMLHTRSVCLTTAGPATAQYLSSFNPGLAKQLAGIPFARLSVVHCSVPQSSLRWPAAFGVVFPKGAAHSTLGIMFNSVLFPHVAPPGSALLTVCLGGHPDLDTGVHQNPGAAATAALKEFLGLHDARVLHTHSWLHAIPQLCVGHHRVVDHMRQVESDQPGLFFCGTDTGGVGVPDRVEVAELVCKRMLQ